MAENQNLEKELIEMGFLLEHIKEVLQLTNDKEKAVELIVMLQEDEQNFNQLKEQYLNQVQNENEEGEEEEKMTEEQINFMLNLGQAIQIPSDIKLKQYKMVILVRMDLKMGIGKIAAQTGYLYLLFYVCLGHAVLGAYKESLNQGGQYKINLNNWEVQGQPKIVLKVNSLEQLLELEKQANEAQLMTEIIQDFGKTQVEPNTITVCAIGPGPSEDIDKITGQLKLL